MLQQYADWPFKGLDRHAYRVILADPAYKFSSDPNRNPNNHYPTLTIPQIAALPVGDSPKQVELRAKTRGFRVPAELIVSCRSGVSLVRSENVRVPVPGRNELARSFSAALEAIQEEKCDGEIRARSRQR